VRATDAVLRVAIVQVVGRCLPTDARDALRVVMAPPSRRSW